MTSAALLVVPVDYQLLREYGYPAVFLVTLAATGAIVFPVPYLVLIVAAGSFLNPGLVALVAGLGAALGELTGYFLGRTGRLLLPGDRWYRRLERAMARSGGLVVFVGAAVPNPLFDAIGLVAGTLRLPVGQFPRALLPGQDATFLADCEPGRSAVARVKAVLRRSADRLARTDSGTSRT